MSPNIPDDVMRAARAVTTELFEGTEACRCRHCVSASDEIIARALLAERQRCADVAKRMLVYADTTSRADVEIYFAILNPPSAASSRAETGEAAVPPLASSPVTHHSDWITWSGGECPVAPDTCVHFRTVHELKSPATPIGEYARGRLAWSLMWSWIGNPFQDIAAYRVVTNLTHEEAQ